MESPKKRNPAKLFWVAVFFILCVLPIALAGPLFWIGLKVSNATFERSDAEDCQTNLKKVWSAIELYAADNDATLPPGDRWVDVTWKYVSKKDPEDDFQSPYRCPAISVLRRIEQYGFAMNESVSGMKVAQIPMPDKTAVIFDSGPVARNAVTEISDVAFPKRHKNAKENYGVTANGTIVKL